MTVRSNDHAIDPETTFPHPGIASLGIAIPGAAISAHTLAELRGADPDKFVHGLGCEAMAICTADETVDVLAARAATRALKRWDGDRNRIGLVAVGTETARDMSRPVSAWVADRLELAGPIRSYEVKHACYGGTLALRQAIEWIASGAGDGQAALVVASDIARYAPASPGEPTQGAGAVAFVVDEPSVAKVSRASFSWSEPAFDFWRPVGEAYPRVDGKFSLECYERAAAACYRGFVEAHANGTPGSILKAYNAHCLHVPFPKMAKKGFAAAGRHLGVEEEAIQTLYGARVEPFLAWNRQIGNAYTASLWINVAHALAGRAAGERISAFSYGSGFGAELMMLEAGSACASAAWADDMAADLAARTWLDATTYEHTYAEPALGAA